MSQPPGSADGSRPTTRSGRGGARLRTGTSSGRPTTGRPLTSGGARPTTRGTGAADLQQQHQQHGHEQQEYLDEWDEEDYESEDDGDVFAFVPPDLGEPATLTSSGTDVYGQPQAPQASGAADMSVASDMGGSAAGMLSLPGAVAEEEEETFYFDEATGAVYDAQGRLVEMPAGFDASQIAGTSASHHREEVGDESVAVGMVEPASPQLSGSTALDASQQGPYESMRGAGGSAARLDEMHSSIAMPSAGTGASPLLPSEGMRRTAYMQEPRMSMDRKSSNASSLRGEVPLNHARSTHALPAMGVLDEVDYLPTSRDGLSSRHGARSIGTTAKGASMVDNNIPVSSPRRASQPSQDGARGNTANSLRQRGNRMSIGADFGRSPDSERKFNLVDEYGFPYDDDPDKLAYGRPSSQLGRGEGLAHPVMDGVEVGAMGMRMVELEMEMEEDSPYPEVRASVSNIDDPDMPAFTLRMFVLAILLNTCAATANILFNLRIPSPQVSPIIVQLVAYPLGKLLARILPIRVFHLPRFLGGGAWSMNPGSFNIKEHALITLTANVAIGQAYAFSSLISLDSAVFYNAPKPQSFQVLYMLSSQLIGFGFSGFCVPFLVTPASMIWPQNLVTATVLNTLHAEEDGLDGTMTRFRYFNILAGAAFLWFFFPNFIFSALSYFNWVCWIWPNSHVVNTVFGTTSGLGMSILTFDWSQIAYIGSPLVAPWWAECNVFAGFVFFYWIAAPILYYKNVFNFARLPFNSSSTWDRFGERYDVLRVLGSRSDLNVAEYEAYSPLYLSVSLYFAYWTGFAAATSVLVHTVLYHGKTLWKGIRRIRTEEDDIHAKFMRRYPTVPDWWYALVLLITFAISVVVVEVWDTDLPVWALLIAILVAAVYALPAGFIYAMTGSLPATNIIGELVAGYMMPRRAVPNMVFKVYCVQALSSGLNFVQDLKVGHYMKVNPRATFAMQLIATGWTAVVQWAVKQFIFGHVERVCDPAQPQRFTCPHANVFFTSSIIWGAVGPDLLFGRDSIYHPIYLGLLVGAVLPIPIWLLARRFPRTPIKFISTPIFFNGLSFIPPASGLNYASWFLTGFIFQYLIRRRNFRWWSKYNFVTSAALDLGTVASFIFMFLTLALPRNGELYVNWWGNNVVGNNIDSQRTPYLPTGPDGFAPPPPPVHR